MAQASFVPCILTSSVRAELIRQATQRITFCAPGISPKELDALLEVHPHLPGSAVRLVVDLSVDSYRVGYWGDMKLDRLGDLDALAGSIQQGDRWRLGIMVVDSHGYIYAPTPQSSEAEQDQQAGPNGLRLDADETLRLLNSIIRPANSTGPELLTLTPAMVEQVKTDLQATDQKLPKENRLLEHLRRQVKIIQFEVRGFQLSRRSLKLPDQIVNSVGSDRMEINDRLAASWRLFADTDKALDGTQKELERELAQLKSKHLVKLSHYGFGVTEAQRPAFQADWNKFLSDRVDKHRTKLGDKVGEMVEQSRKLLRELLQERHAKGRLELPPDKTLSRKSEELRLTEFIQALIDSVRWPTVDEVLSELVITLREYDITAQLLADDDFKQILEKALDFKLDDIEDVVGQAA